MENNKTIITSKDLVWIPTSVTIIIEGKKYTGYKAGMEWFIYALEILHLSTLHKESIKIL
jgi:hypothetical protein